MGIDYYGVLNLNKCASEEEIKQAYRRLALKLHPYKKQEDEKEEKDMFVTFNMIGEAYDVLGDKFFRAVYDQYGEEGLKTGVPGPNEYIQPYAYHGDAMHTFQEFFGTSSPYANLLDVLIHPLPIYKDGMQIGVKKKDQDVYHPLPLTLTEVFYGGCKQVLIRKRELCESLQRELVITRSSGVLLTIRFPPGIEPGSQFRFPEAGNQGINIIPDIIFVAEDISHPVFKREGESKATDTIMDQKVTNACGKDMLIPSLDRDGKEEVEFNSKQFLKVNVWLPPLAYLSTVINITLVQALTGFTITVNTIDGKKINVPITEIVSASYEKVVPGEGLPLIGEPYQRRDLRLRFHITFPLLPVPKISRKTIQQILSPLSVMEVKEYTLEGLNRSILTEKMSQVAVKDQAPPREVMSHILF